MYFSETCVTLAFMEKSAIVISPVDMAERKALNIRSGDTVRVWQKIVEKGKTRRQAFEGLVLAVKHGSEAGGTFTVRKVSSGVGVEKIFPLYSPMIDSVEVVKSARVRRAKLYFIRDKASREVKRQMRRSRTLEPKVSAVEEDEVVETSTEEAVAVAE